MSIGKEAYSPNLSIAKSAGVIGFASLVSRVLGFFRELIIARLFGVYIYAQAFVVAFKIPNLFRDFVGEGATNAAFIPVFSEYAAKRSREDFWELANVVLNFLLVTLAGITLLGIIFSPLIVRLIAPGFVDSAQKFAVTVKLNRIIFPYILLVGLASYATALLNSLKHFTVPAFAPCLLNISVIIFALSFGEGIKGLALGILAGGALQLAVQLPVLYKKGFRIKAPKSLRHPEALTIGRLMVPRVFSSCIYQLNNFVDSIFGSFAGIVGEGGVAVLYFSYRLIQFPLGVFSNAIFQAMLPTLSHQAAEKDLDSLKRTISFGLRSVFFVMLPAQVFFMVLAKPLINALFSGGKFDAYSVELTAAALFFYSIGLSAYGANKILQGAYFSLKDTVTPTKLAGLSLLLNIVLNYILMFPLKIGGIALATSVSGIISFGILLAILVKKVGDFGLKEVGFSFMRILAASIGMGAVCYCCIRLAHNRFIVLALTLSAGVISYAAFCLLLKVDEMRQLFGFLRKGMK